MTLIALLCNFMHSLTGTQAKCSVLLSMSVINFWYKLFCMFNIAYTDCKFCALYYEKLQLHNPDTKQCMYSIECKYNHTSSHLFVLVGNNVR